jgi:hypothetical protein
MTFLDLRVLPPPLGIIIHEQTWSSVSLAVLVVSRSLSLVCSSSMVSSAAANCVTAGCPMPTRRMMHTQTGRAATLTRTVSVANADEASTLRRIVCGDRSSQWGSRPHHWYKRRHSMSPHQDLRSSIVNALVPLRACASAGPPSCLLFQHRF